MNACRQTYLHAHLHTYMYITCTYVCTLSAYAYLYIHAEMYADIQDFMCINTYIQTTYMHTGLSMCVHKTGRECTPYALGRVYLYWMHNLWLYSRLYMVLFHLLNACLPYFVLRSCGRERREKATTPPRAAKFRPEQDDTNYAEVDYVCAESAITIIIWIPSPNPFYL